MQGGNPPSFFPTKKDPASAGEEHGPAARDAVMYFFTT